MLKTRISRVAGAVSVVVFVGLVTFILYTQVQGEPDPVEPPRPPGPHPLEGFDPSQMLPTPLVAIPDVGLVGITLDAVLPSCIDGETRLTVIAAEPFPEGAWISVIPSKLTDESDEGLVKARYSPVSDPWNVTVYDPEATEAGAASGGKDTVDFSLPASLAPSLTEPGYDVLSVTAWAQGDGVIISSLTTLLEPAEVRCP